MDGWPIVPLHSHAIAKLRPAAGVVLIQAGMPAHVIKDPMQSKILCNKNPWPNGSVGPMGPSGPSWRQIPCIKNLVVYMYIWIGCQLCLCVPMNLPNSGRLLGSSSGR